MRVFVRWLTMALMAGLLVPAVWLMSGMWSREDWKVSSPPQAYHSQNPVDKLAKDQPSSTQQWKPNRIISPQQWRNHIQNSCKKLGFYMDHNHFDPSILKHTKILVDDEYKLLYCQIPKVASTTWRRILLILSGKVDVKDPMSMSANDVHHKYDEHLTYLSDLSTEEIVYRLNNYFKFVFVREPFERLLSAFRNKFVTTTNSSMYFKKVFGRRIIDKYRPNPPEVNTGSDLQFEEFVTYLIDPDKKLAMNEHWERFHKLCHPCLITYDFIGKLETIEEDSQYVLNRNSLSGKVKVPSRSDSKYSRHKTHSYMTQYYSRIPREFIKSLYKMYEADFIIFNYTVPDTIKALM